MNNTYFLMRHGESEANVSHLIISDPKVGCEFYGLTERGREQTRASVKGSQLSKYTKIICSDFLRTVETANIVQETLRCEAPTLESGLRERFFGKFEGSSGHFYTEIWAHDKIDSIHTPHGAESPKHLAYRAKRTLARLDEKYNSEVILLISHGDTLRFLQLAMAERLLTEHLEIALFKPAEIRALNDLPKA